MKRYLPFIIIGAVLVGVVIAAAVLLRPDNTGSGGASVSNVPAGPSNPANPGPVAPRTGSTAGAQPPNAKGPENASVVIEEFGDYQCPPCAAFNPVLKKIKDQYGDRIRVVFRNLPLQQIHKNAVTAARAAEAAAMQGRFWEMNDLIYQNQSEWANSPQPQPFFENYARRLNLNLQKFQTDMFSETVTSRIRADLERANAMKISGTPTVYLNGRELPFETIMQADRLSAEIDSSLASKK